MERFQTTEEGHCTYVKGCRVMLEMRRGYEFTKFIEDLIRCNECIRVVHENEVVGPRVTGFEPFDYKLYIAYM